MRPRSRETREPGRIPGCRPRGAVPGLQHVRPAARSTRSIWSGPAAVRRAPPADAGCTPARGRLRFPTPPDAAARPDAHLLARPPGRPGTAWPRWPRFQRRRTRSYPARLQRRAPTCSALAALAAAHPRGAARSGCSGAFLAAVFPAGPAGDLGPLLSPGLAERAAWPPCASPTPRHPGRSRAAGRRAAARSRSGWTTPVRALTGPGALLELRCSGRSGRGGPGGQPETAGRCCRAGRAGPCCAVTTVCHAAPASPLAEPTLLVDTEGEILNTCVLSEVSPGYAAHRARSCCLGAGGRGGPRTASPPSGAGLAAPGPCRHGWPCRITWTATPSMVPRCPPCPLAEAALPVRPEVEILGTRCVPPEARARAARGRPVRMRRPPRDRLGPGRAGLRRPGRPRRSWPTR